MGVLDDFCKVMVKAPLLHINMEIRALFSYFFFVSG